MSYLPDPDKIPDWASSYGEIIERQNKSMALLGTQVARQGEQIRATGTAKSQQIQTLAKFAGDVIGAVKKQNTVRDAKAQEEYNTKLGSFKWRMDDDETIQKLIDYKAGKNRILKDDIKFKELLNGLKHLTPQQKDFLNSMSAKEALYAKEYFSIRMINGFDEKFTAAKEGNAQFNIDYNKARDRGDDYEREFIENWAKDQFGLNRPSDGMMFDGTIQALEQWMKSKTLLSIGRSAKLSSAAEAVQWGERTVELIKGKGELNPELVTQGMVHDILAGAKFNSIEGKDIKDYTFEDFKQVLEGNTDVQRSAIKYITRLRDLGLSGDITSNQMHSIIDALIDHPAGNSLKVFFDKEGFTEKSLIQAADWGSRAKIDVANAANEAEGKKIARETIAANTGDNWNAANIQNALNRMEALGQSDTDGYKTLTDMKSANNSTIEYQKEFKKWEVILANNDIAKYKDEINKIGNIRLRTELQKRLEKVESGREGTGFDKGWLKNEIEASLRYTSDGNNKVLMPNAASLLNHLETRYSRLHDYAVAQNMDDPNGYAVKEIKKYIAAEQGKDGILFYNASTKQYDNWLQQQPAIRDLNKARRKLDNLGRQNPRPSDLLAWDGELNQIDFDPNNGTSLQDILTKKEIISISDIQSVAISKQIPAELIYKARKLGIPPGTLLEAQIIYHRSTEGGEEKLTVLSQDGQTIPLHEWKVADSEVAFWEEINKDKETSSLVKQIGWENLSNNMRNRAIAFNKGNLSLDPELVRYLWPTSDGRFPTRHERFQPIYSKGTATPQTITRQENRIEKGKEDMATKLRSIRASDGTQLYEEEAIQDLLDSGMALEELKKFYYKK